MKVLTEVDEARIRELLERDEFFWLDLYAPAEEAFGRLGGLLGLHPLAMEDTREFGKRPNVIVYESQVLIVFYTARVTGGDDPVAVPIEIHVYVSGGFIVTVRQEACDLLDEQHAALRKGSRAEETIVYRILDTLTDAWYPVIEPIEERVDALEAEVFERTRRVQLARIYRQRQEVREHHRIVTGQREHFQATTESLRSLAGLSHGSREYLRDVSDHLTQVAGELHRQYDDLLSLAQTYFNANADRLNGTATRLTVIGTFFVTWTLVTGFFGQNFRWLVDHVESETDFFVWGIAPVVVFTVGLGGVFWVKRRAWF